MESSLHATSYLMFVHRNYYRLKYRLILYGLHKFFLSLVLLLIYFSFTNDAILIVMKSYLIGVILFVYVWL